MSIHKEKRDPENGRVSKHSQSFIPTSAQDWDGPDDPDNPLQWNAALRAYHLFVAAGLSFVVTYGTSCYAPAIPGVMAEFSVSRETATLGLSLYVLGQGLGPMISSGLSETYGRRAVYHGCIVPCLLFVMGSGLSQNMGSLLICRFLAGALGAAPLSVGAGTISDVLPPHLRASGTAVWLLAPFLGPALGPSTTAYAASISTWRWTMWEFLIAGGVVYGATLFQKETYKKVVLERRARRYNLPPPDDHVPSGLAKAKFLLDVTTTRAVRMLVTEPIIGYFSLYTAFNFGVLFGFFTALGFVYKTTYGFTTGAAGLVFLSVGVGCVVGTAIFLAIDRHVYQRKRTMAIKAGNTDALPPEERLYAAMVGSFFPPIGLFCFAWTARPDIHWMVPTVALAFFGAGNMMIFEVAMLYIIDCYGPLAGASASAGNCFLRYTAGAVFPLISVQMFSSLTTKWAASLLGFVTVALLPIPWVFHKFGPILRARSSFETSKA